ncbi:MAG: hypothetical protein AAF403_07705 [Pseudomonadota bacterium]
MDDITTLKANLSDDDLILKIKRLSDEARSRITNNASAAVLSNRSRKAEIAKRFLKGVATTNEEAALRVERDARGRNEPIGKLAENIVNKANSQSTKLNKIDGIEKQACDALKKTKSQNKKDKIIRRSVKDLGDVT